MGYYKNQGTLRNHVRAYNAAKRRAERLVTGEDAPRLIKLETVSETERYQMAKDADRVDAFNKAIDKWAQSVAVKMRMNISTRSMRVAKGLHPKLYTDNYGLVHRIGFSFPRHGIYIHKGAYKGYGGIIGSKWEKLKRVGNEEISTGIVRHTNPDSLGKQGTGKRKPFDWFDSVIRERVKELESIVTQYFDTMIIDATNIYIDK